MNEEFKVGDWIVLTKETSSNWNDEMDVYDNLCVKITKSLDRNDVEFVNSGRWTWRYSDGSYRRALPHEILTIDIDLTQLSRILEELDIK